VLRPKVRFLLYFSPHPTLYVPDRSTRLHANAIPSLGIASLSCMRAPTHRHLRFSRSPRNASTTSSFLSSQSTPGPPNPYDVIPCTNDYYHFLCPVCLTQLPRRMIDAGDQLDATPPSLPICAPMNTQWNAVLRICCGWVWRWDGTSFWFVAAVMFSQQALAAHSGVYSSPSFRLHDLATQVCESSSLL
jgi:hypothetical protein